MSTAFAAIPGGWFSMGTDTGQEDEGPPHQVCVDPFEMAVHPVTRGEYAQFLDATGHPEPRDWREPAFTAGDLPVVGVSWLDAAAYCAWRSTMEARSIRLPTEAEWECAARGGADGPYPWGATLPAWVPEGGRGPLPGPWPVTLGDPNGFGLLGIAGNVHEWCSDWYAANYYAGSPAHNPPGPAHGVRRASRGGSWRHAVTMSRVTQRSRLDPTYRYTDYGFRVVRAR